jgi:hypothetical protein
MPRYTTSGIPPKLAAGSALGLSAFMPNFNRLAASGAQSYKINVTGNPGLHGIAMMPGAQGIPPSPDPGDMALMGTARSSDAPNMIWPNQYWVTTDPLWDTSGGTAQVEVYTPTRPQDTTMIPVPAVDLRTVYLGRSATLAGGVAGDTSRGKALKQAFNFARWPMRRSGNGPGTGSSSG